MALTAPSGIQPIALAAVLFLVASPSPSHAADAAPWAGDARSAVRLVAGAASPAAVKQVLRAGIEIRLAPGWKTYWRYPGDSGVPPRFDFSRSQNVERVVVRWPAPKSFSDGVGKAIGYTDAVMLPLQIVPADPAHNVVVRLAIAYAICDQLCVPVEAHAELALPVLTSTHELALQASEARVPVATAVGVGESLAIRAVKREPGAQHPRIVVDVDAPQRAEVELFAEGPTPDWALPIPKPLAAPAPGLHRFAFELDGLPAGATERARIKLTAVSGEKAIEVEIEPDAPFITPLGRTGVRRHQPGPPIDH